MAAVGLSALIAGAAIKSGLLAKLWACLLYTSERAFNAVLYSCMIPYALGVLMMLGLAKL